MAGLVNIGFGNLVNDQKISVVVNPDAAALTSSLIPACSVPNMSTKGLCDTSNASGEVSPLWGVVAMSR